MSMTNEQILVEARALGPLEREEVADALSTSLTGVKRAEIDAAWLRECHRHLIEFVAIMDLRREPEYWRDRVR